MAHAQVFLRPRTEATALAVRELRADRWLRSPWMEAERQRDRALREEGERQNSRQDPRDAPGQCPAEQRATAI